MKTIKHIFQLRLSRKRGYSNQENRSYFYATYFSLANDFFEFVACKCGKRG